MCEKKTKKSGWMGIYVIVSIVSSTGAKGVETEGTEAKRFAGDKVLIWSNENPGLLILGDAVDGT